MQHSNISHSDEKRVSWQWRSGSFTWTIFFSLIWWNRSWVFWWGKESEEPCGLTPCLITRRLDSSTSDKHTKTLTSISIFASSGKICLEGEIHEYKPPCFGKQHFFTVKLSEPDLRTKVLRLSVSSRTLENSRSQPSRQNVEPLCWIWNCLWFGVDIFYNNRYK